MTTTPEQRASIEKIIQRLIGDGLIVEADLINRLMMEVESLEATVAKLPVTADGVRVVPGTRVWVLAVPIDGGTVRSIRDDLVEVVRKSSVRWHDASSLFSTAEAAKGTP